MSGVSGFCHEAFEPVRERFERNFESGLEVGASVCVTHGGEVVVDLWGGERNAAGDPWERDTVCNVWSTTKTMAAIVLLMLVDRGEIDLEAPVATYWPEFAANGKEGVLVRHVLSHTAGLPGWRPAIRPRHLADHDLCASNLAAQAPWWEPGTQAGYHLITQGYLEGEIVRRVTGHTLGTFFREEVAEPLGADVHIGLPESEEPRVAEIVPPSSTVLVPGEEGADGAGSIGFEARASAPLSGREPNERWWRAAEIPAAGGTSNARGVARVHAALANGGTLDGVRLMGPATIERVLEEQAFNVDPILGVRMRYGIGFGLMSEFTPLSPSERSFFWGGWGGSIAVIDLDTRTSFAYVMNRMAAGTEGDLRGGVLAITATNIAAAL